MAEETKKGKRGPKDQNKVAVVIRTPGDVAEFLKVFKVKVKDAKGKMFNKNGPVSLDIYHLPENALINMGTIVGDALGANHPDSLVLLSDIFNATAERHRGEALEKTFEAAATGLGMSKDEFAKTQKNSNGGNFKSWDEMKASLSRPAAPAHAKASK